MGYSVEPRSRKNAKGYRFLRFAESIGKSLSSEYGQKLFHHKIKSATDVFETRTKNQLIKQQK